MSKWSSSALGADACVFGRFYASSVPYRGDGGGKEGECSGFLGARRRVVASLRFSSLFSNSARVCEELLGGKRVEGMGLGLDR